MTERMRKSSHWLLCALLVLGGTLFGLSSSHAQNDAPVAPLPSVLATALQGEAGQLVLLPDGRLLSLNHSTLTLTSRSSVTLKTVTQTIALPWIQQFASVTVVPDGRVLIWGGVDEHGHTVSRGLWFDPSTDDLTPAVDLSLAARAGGTATVLSDGHVLLAGGWSSDTPASPGAELWDPRTDQVQSVTGLPTPTRIGGTATLLPDGRVQLSGGYDQSGHPVTSVFVFNPSTDQFGSNGTGTLIPPINGMSVPSLEASKPTASATDFPADGILSLRFSEPMNPSTINAQTITLLGPGGKTPVKVVGVDNGRLAFITPVRDLFPGAQYTLFVQGVTSQIHTELPFTAIDFTVAAESAAGASGSSTAAGNTNAGEAKNPTGGTVTAGSTTASSALQPLRVMTGSASATQAGAQTGPCVATAAVQVMLCRPKSYVADGAWYPGQDVAGGAGHGHWRINKSDMTAKEIAHIALIRRKHGGSGSTGVSGDIELVDGTPLANVDVSIGTTHVRTDASGAFTLEGVPAGRQVIFVDGTTADTPGHSYGQFLEGVDLKAGLVLPLPYRMYMPRILPRDEIELPSPTTRDMIVMQPDMPGLEIHIPAGTVIHDHSGKVVTKLAIVPMPTDRSPVPTPLNFPVYFSMQPGGATVQNINPHKTQGITLVYPNYGHVPAGTPGNFIAYNPEDGWQLYGKGAITPDGAQLKPDAGVHLDTLTPASWSEGRANPGDKKPAKPNGPCCGDPVDLDSGTLTEAQTDAAINDIIPIKLVRYWHAIDSQALINSAATSETRMFGGWRSNFDSFVYSPSGSWTDPGQGVVLPDGYLLAPFTAITPKPGMQQSWVYSGTETQFAGAILNAPNGTSLCNNPDGSECYYLQLRTGTQYWYDDFNGLYQVRDRFGNELTLSKSGGLVQQVTSPSGRYLSFTYNANNNVQSMADNSGRTWTYSYHTDKVPVAGWAPDGSTPPSASGSTTIAFLDKVTYPDGSTRKFTYDEDFSTPVAGTGTQGQVSVDACPYYRVPGTLLTLVDRDGHTVATNTYCSLDVTQQTLADGSSYTFAYQQDSNDNTLSTTVTNPDGNVTVTDFDTASGYPTSVTNASGTSLAETTTYVRASNGLVQSMTDPLGRTTAYTYDSSGNVTSVTSLSGTSNAVTQQFTWTPDYSQIASYSDGLGHTTTFDYTNGCLTGVTDPLGHATSIVCSLTGQPLSITDPLGHETHFTYQGYDLRSVTDPLGHAATYTTDLLGRVVAVQDAKGDLARRQYDPDNDWVTTLVDPMNHKTSIGYDAMGNVTSVTLPSTGTIGYSYDVRNRLVKRTDALGKSESWAYDGTGNVLTHTDRKGQTTTYSYDALGRRIQSAYADGSAIVATYDAGNRMTELNDSANGILQFGWNGLDELTQAVSPQGTVDYTYDAAGRRTSMTAGSQTTVDYTYDNANRLTGLTQGSASVGFDYDAANRRSTLTLPNGVTETYTYDAANEITGISYADGGTSLGDLTYAYDAAGRRTSQGGTLASDALPTATTADGTFDLNNRQTASNGTTLQYDADGNLTGDGTDTYVWNARNQLVAIKQGASTIDTFSYDALGRRQSKSIDGDTATHFLYDGLNPVQETQGATVTPILAGLGIDEYFARPEASGEAYFLTDAQGSTIALTDSSGAIVQQYHYSPYGEANANNPGITNPYQYTGRENDGDGLYYYRARYYSPNLKRFISEDPAGFGGGQNNFYAYVGNGPLSGVDPLGKDIVILNASGGAEGFGHNAELIGNNQEGYVYMSKDGVGSFGLGYFHSLNDFESANRSGKLDGNHYDNMYQIPADQNQDDKMLQWGLDHGRDPFDKYHNNCATFVSGTMNAGGFMPYFQKPHDYAGLAPDDSMIPNDEFDFYENFYGDYGHPGVL